MDTPNFNVHEVFPYLRVKNTGQAIEFYRRAFGAEELFRLVEPSGRIGHAEIKIGSTVLMLSDEYPESGIVGPKRLAAPASAFTCMSTMPTSGSIAQSRGGEVGTPATDAFYGERSGTVRDPEGHEWLLGHEIEKVSVEEMQRRYAALFES